MYRIICHQCLSIIGQSTREVNPKYKGVIENRIICKECIKLKLAGLFSKPSQKTGRKMKLRSKV